MYKFQKDDLVICKPAEEKRNDSNKDFEIYARVADVDREKDIVHLDCYMKQGRFHQEGRIKKDLSLSEMERNEFYQPMNDEEILQFYDGLCELITNARFQKDDVQTTFDIANGEAEKIEKENNKDYEK